MSATARIPQADMERAAKVAIKAIKRTGSTARIIMDLRRERIELILGESDASKLAYDPNEWTDEDV